MNIIAFFVAIFAVAEEGCFGAAQVAAPPAR